MESPLCPITLTGFPLDSLPRSAGYFFPTWQDPRRGSPVTIKPGEVPIFLARGVTPQAAALEAKMDFMITHSPGHMFVTDPKDERLTVL